MSQRIDDLELTVNKLLDENQNQISMPNNPNNNDMHNK